MAKKKNKKFAVRYFVAPVIVFALVVGCFTFLKSLRVEIFAQAHNLIASVSSPASSSTPVLVTAGALLETTPGGWAKLKGRNLSNNIVIRGATYQALSAQVFKGEERVDFKVDPRETPGTYQIYLTSPSGRSNVLPFTVLPTPPVYVPADSTNPTLVTEGATLSVKPGGWAKLKGSNLTTQVVIEGLQFPLLSLQLLSGGQRVDFKVDPRERAGSYKVYVINSGDRSNSLTFTINPDLSGPAPINSSREALWRQYGTTNFYLLSGEKTEITDAIRDYAAGIPYGANAHETVQNIMDWMHDRSKSSYIPSGNSDNNFCDGAAYLSQTANEILANRCALDCNFWTTIFVAVARAKGIPASALETVSDRWIVTSQAAGCMHGMKGHFVADVYTDRGWELADPTSGIFMSYEGSDKGPNGFGLMRFDAWTPSRPLAPLSSGYKYRVFRRGIDAPDSGIFDDLQRKQAATALYHMPGLNNPCQNERYLYSVSVSKTDDTCRGEDVALTPLKYPFSSSQYQLCKKGTLNVSLRPGDNCGPLENKAGIFRDVKNDHWSLCSKDSRINITVVSDSKNCPSDTIQAGVFVRSDGTPAKICYK